MKKSNLVDVLSSQKSSCNPDTAIKNQVVCPKPRRPAPSIPEPLRPFRCTHHRCDEKANKDDKSEKWTMVESKKSSFPNERVQIIREQGYECGCCNLVSLSGTESPPRRTQNPVIHDLRFIHQMELLPPLSSFPGPSTPFSPF